MSGEQPAVARAPETARRFRLASVTVLVLGGLVVAAAIADVPLAWLAHQSVDASGGSFPVWISAGFGAVGSTRHRSPASAAKA